MSGQTQISPPKLPLRFLRWFCSPELLEDVEGDLNELFLLRSSTNKSKAKWLFTRDVFMLFRPGIIRQINLFKGQNNNVMLSNYLKIAFRNALRYKGYTSLNLLGLVVGIASCMLILLWVNDELKVNKFHEKGDQIYQVFRNMKQSGGMVNTTASIPKPVGDLVAEEYSEVSQVAQLSWLMNMDLKIENEAIEEEGRFASPEFLQMFSFPLVIGDKENALSQPNNILISRSVAEKYFGEDWRTEAVGSTVKVEEQFDVQVTGVFEDTDEKSTLDFDWLIAAQAFYAANDWVEDWGLA